MTASQWLEVFASYALQVALLVTACRILESTLFKTSERCAIWSTCFLCILFLGCWGLILPRLHLIQPWAQLTPHTKIHVSSAQTIVGELLLAVWTLGTSVAIVRWMLHVMKLRRFLKKCQPMPLDATASMFAAANIPSTDQQLPKVLINDGLEGPFCRQLHKPTIILPRFLVEGTADDLRYVLLHELEHLKTQHPMQLFWQHIVQATCWFHPAVWRAGSRASLMREYLCDEAAVSEDSNCAGYLRALLRIAEKSQMRQQQSAIGFGQSPSEIILRARRLVGIAQVGSASWSRGVVGKRTAKLMLSAFTCGLALLCIPMDPMSSTRSLWSPWPKWTAKAANCFGYNLRDYELYDRGSQLFEVMRAATQVPESSASKYVHGARE